MPFYQMIYLIPGINILKKIISNLQGNYEGYFILIIFQFYLLHFIITKFKIPIKTLLPISFIVILIHLYLLDSNFNFITENKRLLILPFTAWFGYFSFAYLVGNSYKVVSKFFRTLNGLYKCCIFSFYLIFMSYNAVLTDVSSKRIDIFPLSITISLAIL